MLDAQQQALGLSDATLPQTLLMLSFANVCLLPVHLCRKQGMSKQSVRRKP